MSALPSLHNDEALKTEAAAPLLQAADTYLSGIRAEYRSLEKGSEATPQQALDPADRQAFRDQSHRMPDDTRTLADITFSFGRRKTDGK